MIHCEDPNHQHLYNVCTDHWVSFPLEMMQKVFRRKRIPTSTESGARSNTFLKLDFNKDKSFSLTRFRLFSLAVARVSYRYNGERIL